MILQRLLTRRQPDHPAGQPPHRPHLAFALATGLCAALVGLGAAGAGCAAIGRPAPGTPAAEAAASPRGPGFEQRPGELVVWLGSGGAVRLVDRAAEADEPGLSHRYVRWLDRLGLHVVEVIGARPSGWILVDDRTGALTAVVGEPVPSPDGARLACLVLSLDGGVARLELWRREPADLVRELDADELPAEPGGPLPLRVDWQGADQVRLELAAPRGQPRWKSYRLEAGRWAPAP